MIHLLHYAPAPALAQYILSYGIIETDEQTAETFLSPPLGLCGFNITLYGNNTSTIDGKSFLQHPHSVSGQVTFPIQSHAVGKNRVVLAFMHPLGLYQLFGCTMATLTNTSQPLHEFLGEERYRQLLGELLSTHNNNEATVQALDRFFLAQQPLFQVAAALPKALDYIHQHNGNLRIKDIEKACFITRRSLERHFQVCVGISPKTYANIYRFKCFFNYAQEHSDMTWGELSETQGYFDQSHLTRSFQQFLNTKPHTLALLNVEFITFLLRGQYSRKLKTEE